MTDLSEKDRALAAELLAAWTPFLTRDRIQMFIQKTPKDAAALCAAARRLVTAELAAQAMPDEDGMVEAMARAIMIARDNGGCIVKDWEREERDNPHVAQVLRQARAALSTIRPTLAALQARAEAAGRERAAAGGENG